MNAEDRIDRLIHLYFNLSTETRTEREFALEILLDEINTIGFVTKGPEVWKRACIKTDDWDNRRVGGSKILFGEEALEAAKFFDICENRLKATRRDTWYCELSYSEAQTWRRERGRRRTEKATEANAKRHEEKYSGLRVVGGDR